MTTDSQLFTIRLWPEEADEEQPRWRGHVKHVPTGAWRNFRDWETLNAFLDAAMSGLAESDNTPNHPEIPKEAL
jgi:hypothetical protein